MHSMGSVPKPRHSNDARHSKTAAMARCAIRLPAVVTRRIILVLDVMPPLIDLPDQHQDRLYDVQRLEAQQRPLVSQLFGQADIRMPSPSRC